MLSASFEGSPPGRSFGKTCDAFTPRMTCLMNSLWMIPTLTGLVQAKIIPSVFAESDDPNRLVPIVCRAEDLMIAVSGDPLRTNAYAFVHNGILGFPTTKPILVGNLQGGST